MNPVFPSILSSDFFDLAEKLAAFRSQGVEFIHLDVMDGHFVGNLSFGPSLGHSLKARFGFAVDAHLMVDNPERISPLFADAGADWISFHVETGTDAKKLCREIRRRGCRPGLVANPDTAVDRLLPHMDDVDFFLLMSVFPGRGGQKFIEETLTKVHSLKEEIRHRQAPCLIQVDGGLSLDNIARLRRAGADLFVVGTHLYNSSHVEETLSSILRALREVDHEKSVDCSVAE